MARQLDLYELNDNDDFNNAVMELREVSRENSAESLAAIQDAARAEIVNFIKGCLLNRKERLLREGHGHPATQEVAKCIQGEIDGIGTDHFWKVFKNKPIRNRRNGGESK